MQHRINLFVMYATCIGLLAHTGAATRNLDTVYRQMPGGWEGTPGLTRVVMPGLWWLSTWWPVYMLVGAGLAFGLPMFLRRSPAGARVLQAVGRWMSNHHATVLVLFVAGMFSLYRVVDLAIILPVNRMIEQLTSR